MNCTSSENLSSRILFGCGSTILIHALLRLRSTKRNKQVLLPTVMTPPKEKIIQVVENEILRTPIATECEHVMQDIGIMMLAAARATSESFSRQALDRTEIMRLFRRCQAVTSGNNEAKRDAAKVALNSALLSRPDLVSIRAADMGRYIQDGGSLLHTAARWGNIDAIEVLLDHDGVSPWDRDVKHRIYL